MADSRSINFWAVIPAYNEAQHIADVVTSARVYLPVLVVDDGSQDRTGEFAGAAGAEVMTLNPNQGKGAALRAGFRYALEKGALAVVTLDADGQHEPEEIPSFIDAFAQSGADLIIGVRQFEQMPLVRRFANSSGRWLFSWAVGQSVPDNQSGYRLISRRLVEAVLDNPAQGFDYEVEMITTCIRRGFRMSSVPIQTIYAGEHSHIQPGKHVWNFLRLVARTRMQR